MRYLVAFNNGAADDTSLITSVATPAGTIGGHNTWTDVTGFVRASRWARGRQHEQGRFEAGEATLDMQNEDGRFNPWNTAGPYFGLLAVGVPLQILATYASVTTKQFTGNLHTFKPKWPSNFNSDVEFVAQDAFRLLALANIPMAATSAYRAIVMGDSPRSYWRLGDAGALAVDQVGITTLAPNGTNPGTYHGLLLSPADIATTANITLSGEQTIDGFTTSASRVLVKNQTTTSTNGVYISSSGAWSRASDANTAASISTVSIALLNGTQGTFTFGSTTQNIVYLSNAVTTLGTDPVTWSNAGAPGATQGSAGALFGEPSAGAFDTGNGTFFPTISLASAGWVNPNNAQPFPTSGAYTVEFWVQFRAQPGTRNVVYENLAGSGSAFNSMIVGFDNLNGASVVQTEPNVGIFFSAHQGGGNAATWHITTAVGINDGGWHHIACVVSNFTTGAASLYVDGSPKALTTLAGSNFPITLSGTGTALIASQTNTAGNFPGYIQEMAVYDSGLLATRVLAHYSAGTSASGAWTGQTSGQRVAAVLDAIAWPAGNRNIDTGDATNTMVGYGGGAVQKALKHLQDVERTENGALFVTKDGKIRFVSHAALITTPYTTVQSVFGDRPLTPFFELPYQPDLDFGEDDLDLYTVVVGSNVSGPTITVLDQTAVDRYGYRALDLTGLLGTSSVALNSRANAALTQYKVPLTRVRQVQILPLDSPAALFPEVLARELLDLIQVTRAGIPGSPLVASTTVEHIEHIVDARAGTWVTHYGLGQALAPA